MNQNSQNTKEESQQVQQTRGQELNEKMKDSQKRGEEFRAEHQGRDAMKSPKTSNTEKAHNN